MPPRATIAIPAFNGERVLADALEAALAQTFADREIVVLDDASTDGGASVAVVERYAARGVRLERSPTNQGLAGAWNRCLDLARGDLVAVTHQDDRLDPRFLERTVAALDAAPRAAFVHTGAREVDERGQPTGAMFSRDHTGAGDFVKPAGPYAVRLIGAEPWPICCPAVLARRTAIEGAGRFDAGYRFALDVDFFLRLLGPGVEVAFVDAPLLDYRRHAGQATARERKVVRYAEAIRAKAAALERLTANGTLAPAEEAACRKGLAKAALKVARKFATEHPEVAREHLRLAFRLKRTAIISTEALAAMFRLARAAGRAGPPEPGTK